MQEQRPSLTYGGHPGLRFASVLDGEGGCRDLDWAGVAGWGPEDGVLWLHLERGHPETEMWLREKSGIDRFAVEAMLAAESRPRVEDHDDALLVFLRGVNRAEGSAALDLVPLRLWAEGNRIVSLRDRDSFLFALRDIRERLALGRGPRRPGALFAHIVEKLVKHLEPVIAEFEDRVDGLDETLARQTGAECRAALGEVRRHAINLRRYLAPQREALFHLQAEDVSWLTKSDKIRLRETTDKVLRYTESLDAIRDRTTILHEDLAAMIAEAHARTTNRLTTIAAVLLPPSLFAGLLGANVGGIPGSDSPWAFAFVCLAVLVLFPLEVWVLRKLKWW